MMRTDVINTVYAQQLSRVLHIDQAKAAQIVQLLHARYGFSKWAVDVRGIVVGGKLALTAIQTLDLLHPLVELPREPFVPTPTMIVLEKPKVTPKPKAEPVEAPKSYWVQNRKDTAAKTAKKQRRK